MNNKIAHNGILRYNKHQMSCKIVYDLQYGCETLDAAEQEYPCINLKR
ncbi:MAG: hypothetical protein SOW34_16235 [Oliverpabstia sp.]|nr:hypothetical protein [Oliverpabstia sp.]